MNLVLLIGRLARPAQPRDLPSGDRLVAYELTVPGPDRRAETMPVVWFKAPAAASALDADEEVVVIGRVRRRFFRAGGATQSRTEVVAGAVIPTRRAKRARAVLEAARRQLDDAVEEEAPS